MDVPALLHVRGVAPLPPPPASADWSKPVHAWLMLGNDVYGDCAWAAMLHAVQLWTANAGAEVMPDTACALADYSAETDFTAGPPVANDNGTVLLDALRYWMLTGIAIDTDGALDRLDGFADIEPGDIDGIKRSIEEFGCVLLGVELPESAETQFDAGEPWFVLDMPDAPAGGHAVLAVAYDANGMWVVTWGERQYVEWPWWKRYGSEAYALLRREWIGPNGTAPSGLTLGRLDEMIQRMHGVLSPGAYA
ncbi:MAG TPA: hypothetical protein VNC39_01715 [Acidocella sp.]|uniref:hypothetical protein n=1 Tax=Acidocella sp. TaxID=50710 RepID=UPI002C3D72ED|nr:hypothetical protein [Acidocella sp.]HVE20668.1 hypothetical protein [Acidocella sp.]